MEKCCTCCESPFPITEFYKKRNGSRFTYCKECTKTYNRAYYYKQAQERLKKRREHDKKILECREQNNDNSIVSAYFARR